MEKKEMNFQIGKKYRMRNLDLAIKCLEEVNE